MASAVQKITLSASRDIPLNKLVLSQSNVRRVKAGVSIEDLAADIARRGCLLQSLNVRPVLDTDGAETGMFEVPAGGRRFQALQLLVKPSWREALRRSVVSKCAFDLDAQFDHGHQRKFPAELFDRRKIPLKSRRERRRDFVLSDTHWLGGIAK